MTLESTAVAEAPQLRKQAGYSPADVGHPDSPQMHWHYHEVGGFYRTYDKEPDFSIPEGEPDPFDRPLWPGSFEDERDQFSPRRLIDEPQDSDDDPYYREVDSDFDVPDSDGEYFGTHR